VHATVNGSSARNQHTAPERADLLEESPPIDRTTLNAWEDADVLAAVRAAGRRKLVLCALWTEMCIFSCFVPLPEQRLAMGVSWKQE
jgi:hypothetical protein